MTHAVKTYCIADALAVMALKAGEIPAEDLKGILAMATDIPEDRLADAVAELEASGLPRAVQGMALMFRMANGREPTVPDMRETLKKAVWNDDHDKTATLNMGLENEDGSERADITITKKY